MVNTGIMAAKQTNEIERYTNIEVASNENTVNGLPTTYNMMYQPEIWSTSTATGIPFLLMCANNIFAAKHHVGHTWVVPDDKNVGGWSWQTMTFRTHLQNELLVLQLIAN